MSFEAILEPRRKQVNEKMEEYFTKKHQDLYEAKSEIAEENYVAMRNYVTGKGKRLRSICALMGYEACGGKENEKMILPSLSVEFFHNSSLILDDVMDEDKTRRNITVAHELISHWFQKKFKPKKYKGYLFSNDESRFAVSMSIIATNMLFSLGAQTILDSEFETDKKNKALQSYEKTYRLTNLGQMLDVYYEYEKKITESQYLRMAYLKTGALLGGSLLIGGILAGASERQLKALEEYAQYAATTFQIQDDIMDVTKGSQKGRMLGSDLKKGKTTILVLKARELLDKGDWKKIETVLGNEKATAAQMNEAMKTLHSKGIVTATQKMADQYNQRGKNALRQAKPRFTAAHLKLFDTFADYLMNRDH